MFKNCAPFTYCKTGINNTDIVMPMYNLIEYSEYYSKASGSLWQYDKDEPYDNLAHSESFKSKIKVTGNTPADGNTKNVEIILPLKYLSNFWKTLEMPLINCKVNLILTWSSACVITNPTGAERLAIRDTKLFVPVVTLSTQDNAELLQQKKSGFKRIINWKQVSTTSKNICTKPIFKSLSWRKFSRSKQAFCIIFWN